MLAAINAGWPARKQTSSSLSENAKAALLKREVDWSKMKRTAAT
jgi:hypothetical protein